MRGPSVLQGKVSGVFQRVRDGCGILGFASQMRHILIPILRALNMKFRILHLNFIGISLVLMGQFLLLYQIDPNK
jgi:hypothetical protein